MTPCEHGQERSQQDRGGKRRTPLDQEKVAGKGKGRGKRKRKRRRKRKRKTKKIHFQREKRRKRERKRKRNRSEQGQRRDGEEERWDQALFHFQSPL